MPSDDRAGRSVAGLTVTVCLPPGAADDIDGALTAALAPFDQDSDNPVDRGMWDSRRIRGGSTGQGFAVVRGYEEDPRLVHDEPAYDGTPAPSAPGVCAGGPRALLDLSRPQAAPERAAAASRDLWRQLSAIHPPALPLSVFEDRWEKDPHAFPGGPWADGMLAAYRAQPLINAYIHHPWSLDPAISTARSVRSIPSSDSAAAAPTTSVSSPESRGRPTCSPWTAGGERATEAPFTRTATRIRVLTNSPGQVSGLAARHTCRSCLTTRSWYECTATADAPQKLCQNRFS